MGRGYHVNQATAKRSAEFSTTGEYDVFIDGSRIGGMFRDPENGWWYRTDETGHEHYSIRVIGFNKKEALEKMVRRAGEVAK